jgi:hypothetical protein
MKHAWGAASILLATVGTGWAQLPGPELRVNTYTSGRQRDPHLAVEDDGDFVVVWSSEGQGQYGTLPGVFGQRFAATGIRRGGEFQINTSTTSSQTEPDVAVRSGGEFVVVWSAPVNYQGRIVGRRYDGAGTPVGAEFVINQTTLIAQSRPKVGMAADGSFVVSWESFIGGILARRFDASGTPRGGEITVSTTPDAFQRGEIAVGAGGEFVVVWHNQSMGTDGSGTAVRAQRFDAAGNRQGGEMFVNSYTTGDQLAPSVSISPAGGFVVVWHGQGNGDSRGIFARRFDAAGNGIGPDFAVNTYTTGEQLGYSRQVAHDAAGNFVVTWWSRTGDGSLGAVLGQRFDASGARRGGEFLVNSFTTGEQYHSAIGSDAAGNFVVTWESMTQDGSDLGIYAKRTEASGLAPVALVVDTSGPSSNRNGVLEPGEEVDVRPSWRNLTTAAQTLTGQIDRAGGPAGATYLITDATASYGTVPLGDAARCVDCYDFAVSDPPVRPAVHWDATFFETMAPVAAEKQWALHVGRSFTDVPVTSPYYRFVETLLHRGVTTGCTAAAYCPEGLTTREQLAVFVLVARRGTGFVPPPCGATPRFPDVPVTSPYCPWIEELANLGVVNGCGNGNFCPSGVVTREQMAIFMVRTQDGTFVPPLCTAPMFNDVPASSFYCRWIEELARRNIVAGCGGGHYCPTGAVSRDQMAVFLAGTFGLTVYGP